MAQWVKAFNTKLDDLSLTLETYMVEGKEPDPERCPLTSTYAPWYVCVHTRVCMSS